MIDKDEFDQWKDNPITRWVLEAIETTSEGVRDEFLNRFFFHNDPDFEQAQYLRGKFFALHAITQRELTYEDVVNMHESGELEIDLSGAWVPGAGGPRQ